MQKTLEEQIKHLKNIIKLNEEQNQNQKALIDQLKQVFFPLPSSLNHKSNWNLKKPLPSKPHKKGKNCRRNATSST